MIPRGFQILTQMIVTVSADSGVLAILNNGVLDYLEFLWQATVMRKSKETQMFMSGILLIPSHTCRSAMGPIDHFQVSPYWSHSSPVAWVMLHHHEVQNDAR